MIFSKALPKTERRSVVRTTPGEGGILQRWFWERLIRDDADMRAQVDYVHFNPVKQGLVKGVADWSISTFHELLKEGVYPRGGGRIRRCAALRAGSRGQQLPLGSVSDKIS
jgi:putative transposase